MNDTAQHNLLDWVRGRNDEDDIPAWAGQEDLSRIIMSATVAMDEGKLGLAEKITRLGQDMCHGSTSKEALHLEDILQASEMDSQTKLSRGAALRIVIDTMRDLFEQEPGENQAEFPFQLFREIVEMARGQAAEKRERDSARATATMTRPKDIQEFPFSSYARMMRQGMVYIQKWIEQAGMEDISFERVETVKKLLDAEKLTEKESHESAVATSWILLRLRANTAEQKKFPHCARTRETSKPAM